MPPSRELHGDWTHAGREIGAGAVAVLAHAYAAKRPRCTRLAPPYREEEVVVNNPVLPGST